MTQTTNPKHSSSSAFSRRDLLGGIGAGLLMLIGLPQAEAQETGGRGRGRQGGGAPQNIGAWLHIAPSGDVTVYSGKVEVGQNARTSLALAVAEELRVSFDRVWLVLGDTDLTPYDMGTFGSRTTPTMIPQLRKAAAAARESLLDLAAAQWQVDRSGLTAKDGEITQADQKRTATYGELLNGRQLTQTIPADIALTPAAQWHTMGKPTHKADGHSFVTGRHQYTTDIRRNGMLYGKILRPIAYGATLKSLDAAAAKAMPGVTVVQEGDFVGVVAPSTQVAAKALAALKAEWQTVPQPSGQTLYEQLLPGAKPGKLYGPVSADRSTTYILDATYTIAYIAHTPLEPRAGVAEWKDGKLTVWTGTQRPFGVRSDLAAACKVPESNVRVIVPDTGSGYGGKHTAEAAVEAAKLAHAVGKPVKVVWTRDEEFTWAYFRPAGVIKIHSAVGGSGDLEHWEFDNYNSGPSGIRAPYAVPGQRADFHRGQAPLREGSYRGLAATANHFARESHIDDLAHLVKLDPLAFRLKNLQDPRLKAVLEAAATRFGWEKRKTAPGHGYGIACGTEKGSYVAACVELAVDKGTGKVKLTRIVAAFECGAIVNPLHLENQVEGALVMGIGGALFEAIQFDQGKILNPHLASYRVPRFADVPPIEIVLLDRKDLPSEGAGETPIVAIAPAIRNAILDATGKPLYTMPLAPNGLKA